MAGSSPALCIGERGTSALCIPSRDEKRLTPFGAEENMTDKEAKTFYNSGAWKQKRGDILERDHNECQDCRQRLENAAKEGKILTGWERKIWPAEAVHHLKELKEHPELGLDDDNLISLCSRCHNLRHGRNPNKFVKRKKRLTEEKW